jgi:hypothetical protein
MLWIAHKCNKLHILSMWMDLQRAGLNTFTGRSWPAGRTLPITGYDQRFLSMRHGLNSVALWRQIQSGKPAVTGVSELWKCPRVENDSGDFRVKAPTERFCNLANAMLSGSNVCVYRRYLRRISCNNKPSNFSSLLSTLTAMTYSLHLGVCKVWLRHFRKSSSRQTSTTNNQFLNHFVISTLFYPRRGRRRCNPRNASKTPYILPKYLSYEEFYKSVYSVEYIHKIKPVHPWKVHSEYKQ